MNIEGPVLKGQNGRILATWFEADVPEDGRPLPTVLLCHGFPGYDQFHDLAMVLQRRGFNVMAFHYSGSWGSDGSYSLENGLADTDTVLNTLLDSKNRPVDRGRIFIVGHSLGGFFAAHTFARRPEIRAAVLISPADMASMYETAECDPETLDTFKEQLSYYCAPLNGITGDSLLREVAEHRESYRFSSIVSGFGTRPALIVRGLQDHVTPSAICADALKQNLDRLPGSHAQLLTFDAPHDYLNVREELIEEVYAYLKKNC